LKLHATYVSVGEFDDQYFEISFDTEDPGADLDLSAPMKPYVLLQRQFEDYDGGVCYIETHEPGRYVGHFRLRLVEFTPTRLVFDIDREMDRRVEVTFTLDPQRFQEVERIVSLIFSWSHAAQSKNWSLGCSATRLLAACPLRIAKRFGRRHLVHRPPT
jgi:hypothetical protein